jgi:hypothetical protein
MFKPPARWATLRRFFARLELAYFNPADKQPELAGIDARLREHNRRRWNILNATRSEVSIEAAVQRS